MRFDLCQDQILNVDKIPDILQNGLTKHTTTAKIVSQEKTGASTANSGLGSDAALIFAKDSVDIVLEEEGNLVQNLLIEDSATAVRR
jgi:hypothetical protein